ncbi:MAG: FliM/FliN family flagellar motor switch protein [Planctomycetota bacterium]|jgi:flagellar motor switch protein FliM
MSNTFINNMSREKLQSLLAKAVGSKQAEDTTQTDATEYNWRQPHYFNREQLNKLEGLVKRAEAVLTEKLTDIYHSDFNVTISSTEQHFAEEFLTPPSDEQKDYYISFGIESEQPCGFIKIPVQTAVIWVTQLLGDSASEKDSNRNLTKLEESFLPDIASIFVGSLSDSIANFNTKASGDVIRGHLPFELQGSEELFEIIFGIAKSDTEGADQADQVHVFILCSKLDSVIEKPRRAGRKISADDISSAILGHLQEMPISMIAHLGSAVLSFEEIMSLGVDDILLVDKRIDEPIKINVEDEVFLYGRPAKSTGKYAVVITETPFCSKSQNPTPQVSSNTVKNINSITDNQSLKGK